MQKSVLISLAILSTLTAGYFFLKNKTSETENLSTKPVTLKDLYQQWKAEHKQTLSTAEDEYRFKVFVLNYAQINEHNVHPNKTWEMGVNAFSHLTDEEFEAIYAGEDLDDSDEMTLLDEDIIEFPATNVRTSVDWRSQMNPVRTQAKCGACWAFSAVATIESLYAVKTGTRLELSEQELIDCSGSHGNNGCKGGKRENAFAYVAAKGGLATQAAYPYRALQGACKKNLPKYGRIARFQAIAPRNPEALKAALNYQPVAVAISSKAFRLYRSGIINDPTVPQSTPHAIIAVGYNMAHNPPYYILRNSWGPRWGENGYARIAITDGIGVCGIHTSPMVAVL